MKNYSRGLARRDDCLYSCVATLVFCSPFIYANMDSHSPGTETCQVRIMQVILTAKENMTPY